MGPGAILAWLGLLIGFVVGVLFWLLACPFVGGVNKNSSG